MEEEVNRRTITSTNSLTNPFTLFSAWHSEVTQLNPDIANVGCLATVSSQSKVSLRNLLLQEFDENGFIIMTDARARKIDDIENNPNVAMCFLWDCSSIKKREKCKDDIRQVRIEGTMRKLEREDYEHLYVTMPFYYVYRSHRYNLLKRKRLMCEQTKPKILLLENRRRLSMPTHFLGYKLIPTMMDFFCGWNEVIGLRTRYTKNPDGLDWINQMTIL